MLHMLANFVSQICIKCKLINKKVLLVYINNASVKILSIIRKGLHLVCTQFSPQKTHIPYPPIPMYTCT